MAKEETKEFSAAVPLYEHERFRARFPQYGAVNWFINSALKQFNDACDAQGPQGDELVNQAISQMLIEKQLAA